jgi:hypothetical protein
VAARRGGGKKSSEWGARLGGCALCGFFALGIVVGVHAAGGLDALQGLSSWTGFLRRTISSLHLSAGVSARTKGSAEKVALIERKDGFYAFGADGDTSGPLSANAADDLPVISGPAIEAANGERLLDYAAIIVRAEAALSATISEMRVDNNGLISMFLRRSRTEIALDFNNAALELDRASIVFARWRGHQDMISVLDMTTPGEAVVRVRGLNTKALAASVQKALLFDGRTRKPRMVEARQ